MKIFIILSTILVSLVSCKSSKQEAEVNAEASQAVITELLSDGESGKLGFKSSPTEVVAQTPWELKQFGEASILHQFVKSKSPMKQNSSMFPRFTIIRETYSTSDHAVSRSGRLREFDPSLDTKTKEGAGLVLRDGFSVGNMVWIVTTDAAIFSQTELKSFTQYLKSLKSAR